MTGKQTGIGRKIMNWLFGRHANPPIQIFASAAEPDEESITAKRMREDRMFNEIREQLDRAARQLDQSVNPPKDRPV